ncbi:MAG: sigma-70 family RNA polymerase sigma factor [Planctomycetaceae bacterium]|nr:sigma-70 family RNA polymerase sigma factor [Planctomycetaceae bacterium]
MPVVESPVPETRASLILRLPDARDVEAWDEFVALYEPLVYRLARHKGLQSADAQDVVQEVLLAVSRAVERWDPDREKGRFRDWLFRISRNLVINFLTRKRHLPLGRGGSEFVQMLAEQSDPASKQSAVFEQEFERERFRLAAARVRQRTDEKKWNAFWQTSVEERPIADVAVELNMSIGAVYIARSRVMKQLQAEVQRLSDKSY